LEATQETKTPFSLAGKVAIVTGAARGIGRAIAEAFVEADVSHVVCADVLADALAETEEGEQISTSVLDVADEAGWQSLVKATIEAHGKIDILINNAGVLTFGGIESTELADFQHVMNVNVQGVFLGMRTVVPHMKANRRGVIINTSSSSGFLGTNFVGVYSASKFAVRGLTRSAAMELGLHGIRVNSIHPGGVDTLMTNPLGEDFGALDRKMSWTPMQRYSRPMEVARGFVYLASDAASYCNGAELQIDGGMTAGVYFPGLPGSPENP